jgi:dihydroflavonol-4-reductase
MWLAATKGRRGERYLAAGRHMPMSELCQMLERITGIPAPRMRVPVPMLRVFGAIGEFGTRLTRKPALISLATARLIINELDRSHFDHTKSELELGVKFRPVEATLRDTVAWYQENGGLPSAAAGVPRLGQTKATSARQ